VSQTGRRTPLSNMGDMGASTLPPESAALCPWPFYGEGCDIIFEERFPYKVLVLRLIPLAVFANGVRLAATATSVLCAWASNRAPTDATSWSPAVAKLFEKSLLVFFICSLRIAVQVDPTGYGGNQRWYAVFGVETTFVGLLMSEFAFRWITDVERRAGVGLQEKGADSS